MPRGQTCSRKGQVGSLGLRTEGVGLGQTLEESPRRKLACVRCCLFLLASPSINPEVWGVAESDRPGCRLGRRPAQLPSDQPVNSLRQPLIPHLKL